MSKLRNLALKILSSSNLQIREVANKKLHAVVVAPFLNLSTLVSFIGQESGEVFEVPQMSWEHAWARAQRKTGGRKRHGADLVNNLFFLHKTLEGFDLDERTIQFMSNTWRPATKKAYKSHLR